MAVHVLDDYYLSITLLVTIAYQLIAFSIAFSLKFYKITDFAGGTNFILLSILSLGFSSSPNARQIIASLFLALWAARLSGFLLFRILKTGKDDRFDDKRDKFFPFLGFFVFQMIWVWVVSMPVVLLNSPKVNAYPQESFGTANDIIGVIGWAMGIGLESVADTQKYRFRMNSANKGKVCDKGAWAFSRHPNYAAEILTQFAIYTMCVTPCSYHDVPSGSGPYAALYASIVGPIFLTVLLLFVSGLTLQERPAAKKRYEKAGPEGQEWLDYKRYTERTSILIPMPQAVYAPLPTFIKRTLLLEWPMYRFDPAKHADMDKVRENRAEEGRGSQSTAVEEGAAASAPERGGSKDDLMNSRR
jgi:steroid 5-alpha reductase family enzyme